jgi:hypothetical protein
MCADRPAAGGSLRYKGQRARPIQQVAGRSDQTVEPGHHLHVAGIELVGQAAELAAITEKKAGFRSLGDSWAGAARGQSVREIARRYNVSASTISRLTG